MGNNKGPKGKGKGKNSSNKHQAHNGCNYIEHQPILSSDPSVNNNNIRQNTIDMNKIGINNDCGFSNKDSIKDIKEFKQEISKLKKIIDEQRGRIKKLERSTKDLNKREDMLEEAVNDLYDIHEENGDVEGNLIMTSDGVILQVDDSKKISEEDIINLYRDNNMDYGDKMLNSMQSIEFSSNYNGYDDANDDDDSEYMVTTESDSEESDSEEDSDKPEVLKGDGVIDTKSG